MKNHHSAGAFTSFAAGALALACAGDLGSAPTGSDGGLARPDAERRRGDGGFGADDDVGEVIGKGSPRVDLCGNGLDDDDDGRIDDGCDCTVGTSRACWLGPPDARHVGVCHDGIQRCESEGAVASWGLCNEEVTPGREVLANGFDDDCDGVVDEPDGVCIPEVEEEKGDRCGDGFDDDCDTLVDCDDPSCVGAARCPPACAAGETVCWGGYDDDCDGALDCDDPDCTGDPACKMVACPAGETPLYEERDLGAGWGASSILVGDGEPVMTMTCVESSCATGQVGVKSVGQPTVCVPPPAECPEGTSPNYVASGTWRCDPPCEYIVHYGTIYGGRNVCAGKPMFSCPGGLVPTFVFETEGWECREECNNSLYDQIWIDGMLVCVPC